MGFAGQVFAARVAVGLAMPSPKAFNAAGALVGGFASKMYSQLNQKSVQAAKNNVNNATKSLAKAQARLKAHQESAKKQLDTSAKAAVNSLTQSYGKLGKTAAMSQGAMKGLKAKLGKPTRIKLFSGLSKDLKDAGDYKKMMENFIKLNEAERKEVIRGINVRKNALQQKLDAGKISGKLSVDDIETTKNEIAVLNNAKKEYGDYHAERTAHDRKYNAKTKKYSEDVQKGMVKERQARKELTDAQKSSLIVQTRLTAAAHSFASEMQTNFIDSVRESVSILTAFYYKLNQNTQELINFERELLSANSVFRVTNDELFSVGDTVVQFGQEFGLEMQNGAEGLYQLASAGLSASESMEVLTETLKLSMAVQGDHNTISKLVTQTLFGFDMEMSRAAEVTDKFAFAIQKSLIEYQDLASAVKFALPFFTTTGQSIDQLLGALQILTNRALEAGIAGRGLRQGLAELAESIGDSTARFREYGVEVTDAQGNMLQLTEIAANFSKVLEEGVINDTELLTTLIEDLNVRGATAFVHLVQASDEFTEAVAATAGAGGELDAMVQIQNESIGAQIQILKNNIGMMFMYRDATYEGTRFLNAFHEAIITTVESFRGLLVVERDGVSELTAFGKAIQTIAVTGIKEFQKVLHDIVPLIERFVQLGKLGIQVFKIYLIPIKLVIKALDMMGPTMTKVLISFHLLNKIVPISTAANYAFQLSQLRGTKVTAKDIEMATASNIVTKGRTAALMTAALWQNVMTSAVMKSAASIIGYTAAEGYLNIAQILGIKIKGKYVEKETRATIISTLRTRGLILETQSTKNLTQSEIMRLAVGNMTFKQQMALIWQNWKAATAKWANVAVDEVGILLMARRLIMLPLEYLWHKKTMFMQSLRFKLQKKRIAMRQIENPLMAIKLGLSKLSHGWNMKQYSIEFRRNFLRNMSIKSIMKLIFLKSKKIILDGIDYVNQKIIYALNYLAHPLEMKRLGTGLIAHNLQNRTIKSQIIKIGLNIKENAQMIYSNSLMSIKLALNRLAFPLESKLVGVGLVKHKLESRSILFLINKIFWRGVDIVQTKLKLFWEKIVIALMTIKYPLMVKEFQTEFLMGYVKRIGLTTLISKVFWQIIENVQTKIGNMYKAISNLLTVQGLKGAYASILAKITGNSLSVTENYQKKQGIFLKIWDSTATIRSTLSNWAHNAGVAFSNTLAAIGGAIMYALTIPGKIQNTIVTALASVVVWWNTSADLANIAAKIGQALVTALAAAATIILGAVFIIVTLATWAWNVALYANPVGLTALAVILLIAGLVVLATKMNEQFDLWFKFKLFVVHLKDMFIDLIQWVIAPFVWLGTAVANVLEGPMFKFVLFITHLFMMLSYYFNLIKVWFVDNLLTPIMNTLSTLYNDYLKPYLIDPLVAIALRIVEIVKNPLKALGELKDWLLGVGATIWDAFTGAVDKLWETFKKLIDLILHPGSTWGDLFGSIKDAAMKPIQFIIDLVQKVIDVVKNLVGAAVDLAKKVPGAGAAIGAGKAVVGGAKAAGGAVVGAGKAVVGGAQDLASGAASAVSSTAKKLKFWAEGGTVQGGMMDYMGKSMPYIVGEKGPELFMPKTGGKMHPTKDLSTKRVRDMLRSAFVGDKPGARPDEAMVINELVVKHLTASSMDAGKTRMGIDPFAPINKAREAIGPARGRASAALKGVKSLF